MGASGRQGGRELLDHRPPEKVLATAAIENVAVKCAALGVTAKFFTDPREAMPGSKRVATS